MSWRLVSDSKILLQILVTIFVVSNSTKLFSQSTDIPPLLETSQSPVSFKNSKFITFTENKGQFDSSVLFQATAGSANVYIKKDGLDFGVSRRKQQARTLLASTNSPVKNKIPVPAEFSTWSLNFLNSNKNAEAHAIDKTDSKDHYYLRGAASQVSSFKKVSITQLYKSIDVDYYSDDDNLKYDIILKPGFDLQDLTLQYKGTLGISVNSEKQLVVKTEWGEFIEDKVFAYQLVGNQRKEITMSVHIIDPEKGTFTFSIDETFDRNLDLVIDPTLYFSTYSGGAGADLLFNLATDQQNNIIASGWTSSANFPITSGAFDETYNPGGLEGYDVFVTKYDPNGVKIWSTYIGGTNSDFSFNVLCDKDNNIYINGNTLSADFPVTPGTEQTSLKTEADIFLLKLDQNGALIWSTYFGGSSADTAEGLVITNNGQVVISGYSNSTDYPVSSSAYQKVKNGNASFGNDIIVSSFNITSGRMIWSTFVGGNNDDKAEGINVDSDGNFYITGETFSTDFPVKNAFQNASAGAYDAILFKLNSDGSDIIWSTYYGGNGTEYAAEEVGIDSNGDIIVAGYTFVGTNNNFPITHIQYPTTGDNGTYIIKFDKNGIRKWATFYGHTSGQAALFSLTISGCDQIWVAIQNDMANQPTTPNAFQRTKVADGRKTIVACYSPAGYLDFATYYAGNGSVNENAWDITSDTDGNIIVGGFVSGNTNFPVANASQPVYAGGSEGFLFKFKPDHSPPEFLKTLDCSGQAKLEFHGASGNSISWDWGDGSTDHNVDSYIPSHNYPTEGQYTITVTINESCGNVTTATTVVDIVNSITAAFSYVTDCNKSAQFTFTGQGATSFVYNFEPTKSSTERDPYYSFSKEGDYLVTVTAFKGTCFAVYDHTVPIRFLQKPNLPATTTLCVGESFSLNAAIASPSATYTWQNGSTNPTIVVTQPGTYSVSIKNQCGEVNAASIFFFISKPSVNLGDDKNLCSGVVVLDAQTSISSYLWQDGSTNPTLTVNEPGQYRVVAKNQCGNAEDIIDVNACPLIIPNVITPNGDGLNDLFIIGELRPSTSLLITNRSGSTIFQTDYYKNDWGSEGYPAGTYYFF